MNNMPQEEEGIDIMALVKGLWNGKLTIILWTCIFIVLGFVAAMTMKRTYTTNAVLVPQLNSKSSSSLSSLASLAGIDLGTSASGSDISPVLYPQIVNSTPFRLELMHTPLHFAEVDTAVSWITYLKEYQKPTVMGTIKKYTVGLPGVIMSAISKEKPEVSMPGKGSSSDGIALKPVVVTKDEEKMLKIIAQSVSLAVEKKEGYLTLNVTGTEPIMTAELALKAQQLLQDEITRIRVEKVQSELDYIQDRYDEVKAETESYQVQLATITDRTQNVNTTRDKIEKDRIQTKYNVASAIYSEMAKQLEQAKMQVKKETPTFTVIQPVKVPMKAANSRAKTLIGWTFFGFILGCGIVLGKDYLPKLKEKFNA